MPFLRSSRQPQPALAAFVGPLAALLAVVLLLLSGSAQAAGSTSLTIAKQSTSGFTVSWSPVSGAKAYTVWIESPTKSSGKLGAGTTSYAVTGLAAGATYTVKLDALVSGSWRTVASTSATTTAAAAPTLGTANVTSSGFTASWSAVAGAGAYSIWVEPVSANSGQLPASTLSWAFGGASPATTYTVKLDVLLPTGWATLATTSVTTAPDTTTTVSTAPAPAPSTSWTLADPIAPVTAITNPSGLGLNINNVVGGSYHDIAIDGGGDSSILLQGTTTATTLSRIHITRTDANPTVSWAAHGIYAKARGNSFSDIYADNTGGHGVSGFSVRMGNNAFTRTVIKGYAHAVTYYEHDGASGSVSFSNGTWSFTGDTAVWGDDSNEPPNPYIKQSFLFENINATGPAGAYFLKFGTSAYVSGALAYRGAGVVIRNCTLNGQPVTAAKVAGVPSGLLTIQ